MSIRLGGGLGGGASPLECFWGPPPLEFWIFKELSAFKLRVNLWVDPKVFFFVVFLNLNILIFIFSITFGCFLCKI